MFLHVWGTEDSFGRAAEQFVFHERRKMLVSAKKQNKHVARVSVMRLLVSSLSCCVSGFLDDTEGERRLSVTVL